VIFRRPLHEVAAWPAADVALLNAYLAHRPPAGERLEAMFATFMASWVASKQARGSTPPKPSEFLTFRGPFPAGKSIYAEQNRQSLLALQNLSARLRR